MNKMVYIGHICMACGGTLTQTDREYSNDKGNGHYYSCAKCGAYYPVLELVYL